MGNVSIIVALKRKKQEDQQFKVSLVTQQVQGQLGLGKSLSQRDRKTKCGGRRKKVSKTWMSSVNTNLIISSLY